VGVSMIFRIKNKHALAFMIWLELLGYVKKVLSDGSCTFSGKGTKKSLSYVFVKNDLTGNAACQSLYEEFVNYQDSNYVEMQVA